MKHKSLEEAKTWNELREIAENRGLKLKRISGGHAILGNDRGSMPFSTHEKEPGKGLLHKVKKQIIKLTALGVIFLFIINIHNFI